MVLVSITGLKRKRLLVFFVKCVNSVIVDALGIDGRHRIGLGRYETARLRLAILPDNQHDLVLIFAPWVLFRGPASVIPVGDIRQYRDGDPAAHRPAVTERSTAAKRDRRSWRIKQSCLYCFIVHKT